jgi:anoctamin-1
LWKRYSAEITHRWDLTGFDIQEEHPRPQYLARLKNVKRREVNIVTNMVEPHVPFWRMKLPATVLSFSVVLLLVCWPFEGFEELGSNTDICIVVSYGCMLTYKI